MRFEYVSKTSSFAMKPNLHQSQSEATRERLLSSAMQAMQHTGAGTISIAAVAQAAGMTTGAVQHHFPSKAALMMQVLGRLVNALESDTNFWPPAGWSLARRADHFVQQAWAQLYSQPRFSTAWAAYLAARDDALMMAHIAEQRSLIQQRMHAQFILAFPELAAHPQADARIQFIFTTLRGLGLVNPFASKEAVTAQLAVLSDYIQSSSVST
jgi:AcrR family transcriptional regulator